MMSFPVQLTWLEQLPAHDPSCFISSSPFSPNQFRLKYVSSSYSFILNILVYIFLKKDDLKEDPYTYFLFCIFLNYFH